MAIPLKLTNGERVRLIGIAPESKPNDKAKRDSKRTGQDLETINKMGQEATDYLKWRLEKGQEVRLVFDVEKHDKYKRLLAYIFLDISDSDCMYVKLELLGQQHIDNYQGKCSEFLNATIIKAGYATPMTIPPNVKYADKFKELYEEAREQKRGLWR